MGIQSKPWSSAEPIEGATKRSRWAWVLVGAVDSRQTPGVLTRFSRPLPRFELASPL